MPNIDWPANSINHMKY